MDLNRLFYLHQMALMRAAATGCHGERDRHHAAADGLAHRIAMFQRNVGAAAAPLMPALGQ